jgi:hypothetical protein
MECRAISNVASTPGEGFPLRSPHAGVEISTRPTKQLLKK